MKTTIQKLVYANLKRIKNQISSISAQPQKVALGYALGIFLAATPLIGLKVFIAIPLTCILKWNKIAAIIGIFHINPFTGPIFYGLSFFTGKGILGTDVAFNFSEPFSVSTLINLISANLTVFGCLLIGGVVLGLPLSMIAYYLSLIYLNRKNKLIPKSI